MDNSLHWDGMAPSGKMAAGDVFVWQAVITFSDGIARVFRGDVLMLK